MKKITVECHKCGKVFDTDTRIYDGCIYDGNDEGLVGCSYEWGEDEWGTPNKLLFCSEECLENWWSV